MAESRLVPCNLMAWPRIRDLLPDQKLIIYHLWATCHEASGCQLLDLGGCQGALSITAPAIQEAVCEFQRRGLVDMDEATGEVAILDWGRFHRFPSPSRRRLLEDSIRRIQSPRLRGVVEKSMTYALRIREGKEIDKSISLKREGGSAAPGADAPSLDGGKETPSEPKKPRPPKGYQVDQATGLHYQPGNQDDAQALEEIRQHAPGAIAAAVQQAAVLDRKGRAWPSAVWKILTMHKARSTTSGPPAWATMGMGDEDPPAAATAGVIEGQFEVMEG